MRHLALAFILASTLSHSAFSADLSSTPAQANPQMQAVLDSLAKLNPKPLNSLTAQEARKQPTPADAVKVTLKEEGKPFAPQAVAKVENRSIPGAVSPIPIRIYTPQSSATPLPVLVYYHGGGWVIANKDVYDSTPRALANLANAIIVSVDYREAPEHKFPASHDDAFAAYQWVLKNAKSFNGNPDKIAVGGESAGGNLAVAVSMMARDQGLKLPVHQMVIYPIAGIDMNTPSYQENSNSKPLNKGAMAWFFEQEFKNPSDKNDPRINLVQANLKGLPSTTLITAQIDPLRSEGTTLADNLKKAGVDVHFKNFSGVTHEFFGMGAVVDQAKDAEQMAANDLKKAFTAT